MDLISAKEISVIGNSAAGKSTLSNKLGRMLEREVFSIDKIYWRAGWEHVPQASFKKLHDKWLAQNTWIIDGVGYWKEMVCRIMASDLVIFLDTPLALCKERAQKRMRAEQLAPNDNITADCVYGDVKDLQMNVIDNFHTKSRPKIMNYLSDLNPEKIRIVCSLDELNIENKTSDENRT